MAHVRGIDADTENRREERAKQRPDGTRLNEFMPWKVVRGMTDAEIHAIWLYLRSVPPKPFGNK